MELSPRKEKILSSVIEYYISTGEPAGSKLIAAALPVAVSSATIRNEMAELSAMGLLYQPHTSAGRVPSDTGFRYYVDRLLLSSVPADADVFRILSSIDYNEGDTLRILSQICDILSSLTGCCAVATTPYSPDAVIKGVRVVPVGKRSAVVIATMSTGILKSRVAKLSSDIDYPLIELFCNVAASNFDECVAGAVTTAKIQSIAASLGERSLDIAPLLVCLFEAVNESSGVDVIVKGHENLLKIPSVRGSALEIIELARTESSFAQMLSSYAADSPEVIIGRENRLRCMQNTSSVLAPYFSSGVRSGVLGVIGAVKMDYAHIIPIVNYISSVTGRMLTENADASLQ